MDLFAAVDILRGNAVRLTRGDFDDEERYGNPVELARSYAAAGAPWIHVVDLDAARTSRPVNRDLVLAIAEEVDARVQVGGGVRSEEDAELLLLGGAARVVLGTAAVTDPELVRRLCEEYPGRVAVGIDHRRSGSEVAVSGWEQKAGTSVADLVAALETVPVASVIVTDIERDGTLAGPGIDGVTAVLRTTRHDVVASGGVRNADDLLALGRVEVDGRHISGVIVGKALAEGILSVEDAVAACERYG